MCRSALLQQQQGLAEEHSSSHCSTSSSASVRPQQLHTQRLSVEAFQNLSVLLGWCMNTAALAVSAIRDATLGVHCWHIMWGRADYAVLQV